MDKKESVAKFRLVVIVLNCLLASLSLINLYTIATGAVQVEIPEEEDFAWAIDTRYEEASFIANFTVTNQGIYDITNLNIHAVVTTEKGSMLVDYRQDDLTIPSGYTRKFNIVAVMPFSRVDLDEWKDLMVNDSVFYLDVDIRANYLWGLSTFVVDDILEYPWEAPIHKIENGTDEDVIELIKFFVAKDPSVAGFMDAVMQDVKNNPWVSTLDWDFVWLRIESWPLGDNTSRMVFSVNLDLLEGRHTITFELVMWMKMEDDYYEIRMEEFSFTYR
jgi:hypothetical protein